MKLLEQIKLLYRANKYKRSNDIGGIAYIHSSIQAGQTVFDIGSHKAAYLYWMLKLVGNNGKVYAFEPQYILYQYIQKLILLFKWKNVSIEHLALSDSEGTTSLYIPANTIRKGSSPSATISDFKPNYSIETKESVKTQTLDQYCKHNYIKPHFLKIDVEGNELKVLQGGLETLKTSKPKILIEIEARHVGRECVLKTFELLYDLGYNGYVIHGIKHIPLSEFTFELHQNINDKKNYCNNFIFE
jgi:FkbM family methyltransferase